LLAKGEDFESDISTGLEEDAGGANQGEEKRNHGIIVHDRARRPPRVTQALDFTMRSRFGNRQVLGPPGTVIMPAFDVCA
jgi:hypothetical protein